MRNCYGQNKSSPTHPPPARPLFISFRCPNPLFGGMARLSQVKEVHAGSMLSLGQVKLCRTDTVVTGQDALLLCRTATPDFPCFCRTGPEEYVPDSHGNLSPPTQERRVPPPLLCLNCPCRQVSMFNLRFCRTGRCIAVFNFFLRGGGGVGGCVLN